MIKYNMLELRMSATQIKIKSLFSIKSKNQHFHFEHPRPTFRRAHTDRLNIVIRLKVNSFRC